MLRALLIALTVLALTGVALGQSTDTPSQSAADAAHIPPLPAAPDSPQDLAEGERLAQGKLLSEIPPPPGNPEGVAPFGEILKVSTSPVKVVVPELPPPSLVAQQPATEPPPVGGTTTVIGAPGAGESRIGEFSTRGTPGPGEGMVGPPGAGGPGGAGNMFIEGRTLPPSNVIGAPQSASQGIVTQADLRDRPLLRPTDIFEQIPGMIFANETNGIDAQTMFLRGFNIDHGTDFAFFVEGVPMNLGSNPHAQGYTDINFVIPELVSQIDYGKGPYYAKVGNFSAVGYADIHFFDVLPYGIAKVEAGKYDWFRTVVADSCQVGRGTLVYGVQYNYFDNAYSVPEHLNRSTAIFRYSIGDEDDRLTLSTFLYNGSGTSEPVIPLRLTGSGLSRFTNVSPSDFIVADRFLVNGGWQHKWEGGGLTQANVYGSRFTLSLIENPSGFTAGPEGDQIDQIDQRWTTGVNVSHSWKSFLIGDQVAHTIGVQVRRDDISRADVFNTIDRGFTSVVSSSSINETDTGLFYQNEVKWSEKIRTVLGLRGEFYDGDVTNHLIPANSGDKSTAMFLPKGSLVLGPWEQTQFFLNGGYSFHSNNAGGAVATVDVDGNPVNPVPLLVQARGAEIGVRSQRIPNLTTAVALWQMHLGSELVFDVGSQTTQALRSSDRYGIEWTNTYQLSRFLSMNADYSWSHGRLLGVDPDVPGQHIPNAITTVFSGGPSVRLPNGLFTNLRYRYWGPRYLIEDGSASSRATNLVELSTGYECQRYTLNLSILNLLNSNGHDIDFFDTTFYPNFGDAAPTQDILFKPLQPFQARFSVTMRW